MSIFFDILFPGSVSKRIYKGQFNEALKKLSDISSEERKYLSKVFEKDLADGLTEYELKNRIENLRHNPNDCLDYWEVEHIKNKLLEKIRGK